MVLSTRPLIDLCPVQPAAMEGRQIVQWDKDSCADAGFLKIDLLGLGMLSAVERCVEQIAAARDEHIDLSRIPLDDPQTYEAIQAAETTGVVPDREPGADADAAAQPPGDHRRRDRPGGAGAAGADPGRRRPPLPRAPQAAARGPDFEIPYEHPALEPILADTLGAIVFQDQVIQVAMALAGFAAGEAEGLRRAMSRKRSEEALNAYGERFVAGAMARGVDRELAERVFEQVARLLGVRLSEVPRRRLRPARLPVDLAARPLRPRAPLRAASTSSRWASTRPTRSPMRRSGAGSRSGPRT